MLCSSLVSVGFADLHFLAVGDWGGLPFPPWASPAQLGVARAMGEVASQQNSSFVLSVGDHFYFRGVRSADDKRWRRSFEQVYDHESLSGPGFWRAVAGNHDHEGNITGQLAYASRPSSRWHYPSLQYSWREELQDDAGTSVDFVMLDTVMLCGLPRRASYRWRESAEHWRWAKEALLGSGAAFLVVAGHYPVHSPSSHGPTECLVRRLEPLLRRSRASVYLSAAISWSPALKAALPSALRRSTSSSGST